MASFAETEIYLSPDAESQNTKQSRKRRKKSRLIKQGYHKSERDDARRVAARTFLSGIPLDSQQPSIFPTGSSPDGSFQSQLHQEMYNAAMTSSSSGFRQSYTDTDHTQTPRSPVLETRPRPIALGSPKYVHRQPSPVKFSRSLDPDSPPHRESVFWEPAFNSNEASDKKLHYQLSLHGGDSGSVHVCGSMSKLPATMVMDRRLVFASNGGFPFAISSVISYKREEDKQEFPQRARTRVNSTSLQIDLDVDLGTIADNIEASLGFLFFPFWVQQTPDLTPHHTPELTPPLLRKQSFKRLNPAENFKKLSNPHPVKAFHWNAAAKITPIVSGAAYPWQFFRENHSAGHVIAHYHPNCLDNYEFFVGNQTATFLLEGKRVSIIQYARPSDIKKGVNEQFADVFPYIKLTLSKLRSIKREMQKAAEECELELDAVAYAYVYFEKLILMGKINKTNRKIIAGVCLLLAAKFYTDVRQRDIISLVNRLADSLHLSTKELVLHEFPVLVSLQFSLLVPTYQAQTHFDRLKDFELAQN